MKQSHIEYSSAWKNLTAPKLADLTSASALAGFSPERFVSGLDKTFKFASVNSPPTSSYDCSMLASSILMSEWADILLKGKALMQDPVDLTIFPTGIIYKGKAKDGHVFSTHDLREFKQIELCRFIIRPDGTARSVQWRNRI